MHTELPSLESLRRRAKEVKKAEGIPHTKALDKIAAQYGFPHWPRLLETHPEHVPIREKRARAAH